MVTVQLHGYDVTWERGEDGVIVAECQALPGCVSQGRTTAEALGHIRDAIETMLDVRRRDEGKGTHENLPDV